MTASSRDSALQRPTNAGVERLPRKGRLAVVPVRILRHRARASRVLMFLKSVLLRPQYTPKVRAAKL